MVASKTSAINLQPIRMNAVQIFNYTSNSWKTIRFFGLDEYDDAAKMAHELIKETVKTESNENIACVIVAEVDLIPAILRGKQVYVVKDTGETVIVNDD